MCVEHVDTWGDGSAGAGGGGVWDGTGHSPGAKALSGHLIEVSATATTGNKQSCFNTEDGGGQSAALP